MSLTKIGQRSWAHMPTLKIIATEGYMDLLNKQVKCAVMHMHMHMYTMLMCTGDDRGA